MAFRSGDAADGSRLDSTREQPASKRAHRGGGSSAGAAIEISDTDGSGSDDGIATGRNVARGGAAREDSDSYDTRRFDASALSSDDGDEYDDEPDSGNTADSPGATAALAAVAFADLAEHGGMTFTRLMADVVPKRFNEHPLCASLRDLLQLPGTLTSSVHFNYGVDSDWLVAQYPAELRPLPMYLVVGKLGDGQLVGDAWRDQDNVTAIKAPNIPQYGTHHTKMMLLFYEEGLRVVIHTANLCTRDWVLKTNAAWVSPMFPRVNPSVARIRDATRKDIVPSTESFATDLWDYLSQYGSERFRGISVKTFREQVAAHDMSAAKVRLVGSVPGFHRGRDAHLWGHMRLRRLLALHGRSPHTDIVCQCSSIGSLGKDCLGPKSWMGGEFLESLRAAAVKTAPPPHLRLIYPTVENVRTSLEGWAGGGAMPHSSKYEAQHTDLLKIAHVWRAEWSGRTRALPHVKTFSAWQGGAEPRLAWVYLGSHNLSKAAWGQLQKGKSQLHARSYELGVLQTPELAGGELIPQQFAQAGAPPSLVRIPIPYDWPLTRYHPTRDDIWYWDKPRAQPDSLGETRGMDRVAGPDAAD